LNSLLFLAVKITTFHMIRQFWYLYSTSKTRASNWIAKT